MKKRLIFSVIISILILMTTGISIAQDDGISSFLDYIENNQNTTFGYSSDDKLVIKYLDTSNYSVDVESPVIKDGSIEITSYLFDVSEESRANRNPVAVRCFYNINVNGSKFTVNLDMSSLNKNKTYYLYATPIWYTGTGTNGPCTTTEAKNFVAEGVAGKESTVNGEDPCININSNVYGVGTYCEEHSSNGGNGGGSSSQTEIYSINNVSHICEKDGTTTVTWQSYADVNVEIFLWNDDKDLFEKIGTAFSERKSFNFTPKDENGHFSVRFEPVDGSQKINYDGHCLVTTNPEVKPTEPTPVKPPVVGPKENIMIIIIGTIILYIVYRFATRKRS